MLDGQDFQPDWVSAPGETIALREVFDLSGLKIERHPMTARVSYVVL